MGYLEQAVRSRWAVPMTAFLIQLSQYWNTLVTVTWWSKRATVSVVWFCVLWLATILLLFSLVLVIASQVIACDKTKSQGTMK